jgi:hypothetical protein
MHTFIQMSLSGVIWLALTTVVSAQPAGLLQSLQEAAKGLEQLAKDAAAVERGEVPDDLRNYFDKVEHLVDVELHYLKKVTSIETGKIPQLRTQMFPPMLQLARELRSQRNNHRLGDGTHLQDQVTAQLLELTPAVLSDADQRTYAEHLAERQQRRSRAAAEMMTSNVDRILSLNSDQYKKIADKLEATANPDWTKALMAHLYTEYCPLPDADLLQEFLTKEQNAAWKNQERNSRISFGWDAEFGLRWIGISDELETE